MDLWVVAAAAGAGYIAKYWQNIAGEGGEVSLESQTKDAIVGQSEFRNPVRPLRKLTQKQLGREDEVDTRFSELHRLGTNSKVAGGLASTSGRGDFVEKTEDYNILSLASLPPGLYGRGSVNDLGSGSSGRNEVYDKLSFLPDSKGEEIHPSHRFARSRLLRSRRPYGYSLKPVNSLESCLTAQLYREHTKIQEYMLSSLPRQSTPSVRPLLVTDGSRVISRASSDFKAEAVSRASRDFKRDLQFDRVEERMLLGAPPLPKRSMEIQRSSMEIQRRSMEVQRRSRLSIGGPQSKRFSIYSARAHSELANAQGNPMPNAMLLLFVGITIGILSAGVANKREIEKLNELLMQNENLVQDLHDELEMKSSLSVRELPNERHSSPKLDQDKSFDEGSTTRGETKQELDNSSNVDSKKEDNLNPENFETMSKIEAELEAELERLELNMKASTLERISGLVELDPEFEADVVQGELRLKPIRREIDGTSDSDHDVSGACTDHLKTPNYAVSPRELSLRLHEVIQSRLEMRILELEAELQDSQKRGQFSRSENSLFHRGLYSDIESSSTHGSLDDGDDIDQPLVINLSGEAVDAYNEAYEEIFRMTKTEEETPTETRYNSDHGRYDKELCQAERDVPEERWSESRVRNTIRDWEEQISSSRESRVGGESESEDGDDLGELLIKQIVEKARQGSPAVRNAQRMLYAMDEQ